MRYKLHPCYFYRRFRNDHFRASLSGFSNAVSSTPPHKKKNKNKKKTFGPCEILFLFHFTFTIEISHFKFFAVSHVFFLSYKRKKRKRRKITKQKESIISKLQLAWFFFKPPTIDPSIHRSFKFLKI